MKKFSLTLIITIIVILEAIGFVQYYMARQGVKKELLYQAERDMAENHRVALVRTQVETAVKNILPTVMNTLETPDNLSRLMGRLVADNPNVVGAGVAFKPNYYADEDKKGLFAPYAYDMRPEKELTEHPDGKAQVQAKRLNFNYLHREWFVKPMVDGQPLWTSPYLDQGGTHILLCSYVVPISVNGQLVGVFFADVPLHDVSVLSQSLNAGISQSGIIVLIIQVLGVLVIACILWRAYRASARYKEEVMDPEKERLQEQLEKMKEVNARLVKRNQELAAKMAELRANE